MGLTGIEITEQDGIEVTITKPGAKNVIQIDSAETTSFTVPRDIEDETIIEVDTSSAQVSITLTRVGNGTGLTIVNSVGSNGVSVTTEDGLTANPGEDFGLSVIGGGGAIVEYLFANDVVYGHGDTTSI